MASHQAITILAAILVVVPIIEIGVIVVAGVVALCAADVEEFAGAVPGSCVAFHCDLNLWVEGHVLVRRRQGPSKKAKVLQRRRNKWRKE
jgi:hypothetical protein